jgi:NAD-dependent SIR2 family protein deacetylase
MAAGDAVLFVGAGISTENKSYCQATFYDKIRDELGVSDNPPFPELMSMFCRQSDGRIRLLEKIKSRIDYFLSFDDLYQPMARFHRAISPLFMITDVITTNWDDLFQQECGFSPFVYDSDLAFWDAAKRRVMKIHGSISNFGSIVATTEDYKKSFKRLNDGPLGAQLKSLIARKTVIYVGYSLSDENYLRLLRNISTMMNGNVRQSYFVSPQIDQSQLRTAPIQLIPVETDGTFFLEQMRKALSERCGIISEEAFVNCELFFDEVAEKHDKTADAFIKTQHPLLIFALSYQDGLIHSLQRIGRMWKTGEYHSTRDVFNRVHGYDRRIDEFLGKKDFWNAAYAQGYQTGLLFLLLKSKTAKVPKPPLLETMTGIDFKSLSSLLKFPSRKIPKPIAANAKRILKAMPKRAGVLPDHTAFL